jgi:hypothetical protein
MPPLHDQNCSRSKGEQFYSEGQARRGKIPAQNPPAPACPRLRFSAGAGSVNQRRGSTRRDRYPGTSHRRLINFTGPRAAEGGYPGCVFLIPYILVTMFPKLYTALFLSVLFSACTPAATAVPGLTAPALPSATRSPIRGTPSQIATPEPTAKQQLPAQGPYFIFPDVVEENIGLTLLGLDAVGRKEIPIPGNFFDPGNCFPCIVSPDGEWLAYWTGFAGDRDSSFPLTLDAPYDLQLNLLHIPDGTTTVITPLLSPDYPANFDKVMDAIINQPELYDPNGAYDPEGSFVQGIRSAAWSPNSRYLAFAGEMDGPSSDLYVYDVHEKTIRRLSSGLANITGEPIRWSPDGKWIVYSSGYWWGEGMTLDFYAAHPDGSAFREYPAATTFFTGWLSDSVFLISRDANGIGMHWLESADLESGRISTIWKCSYSDIAFDPGKSILVSTTNPIESEKECQKPGLYFQTFPTGCARLVTGLEKTEYFNSIDFLGLGDLRYLVSDWKSNSFSVSSIGESNLLLSEELVPYIAPDRQWVAFAGKGFRIMDSSGAISDQKTDVQIDNVIWRPDSKGFLFTSGSNIYSVSLPGITISWMDGIQYPSKAHHPYWQPDSLGYFFTSGSDLYFLSLRTRSLEFIQQVIPFPNSFDPVWVAVPE